MCLQLPVSVTRDIIGVVVLVRSHRHLSFGPEASLDENRVFWFHLKIILVLKIIIGCDGDAVLALALSIRQHVRVHIPEILRKLGQLRHRLLGRVGHGPRRLLGLALTRTVVLISGSGGAGRRCGQ